MTRSRSARRRSDLPAGGPLSRFSTHSLVFGCALVAALLSSPGPARADHRSLYVLGLEAVDFGLWPDGVILFSKAIAERPEAGGLVRPYGTWTESYVPHYYLGLCLYELGRYSEALDQWDRFEAQPASGYPRNRPKRARVAELRREAEILIPRELEGLRQEIARIRARLGERRATLGTERGDDGTGTDLAGVVALLDEAARSLEGSGTTVDLAEVLRGVRPVVDSARERLLEEEEMEQKLRRERRIARELEERQAQRQRYAEAVALLASGECSRPAIDTLIDLVHRSALGPSELGDDSAPILRLVQAHLQCSDLERARQYLEIAMRRAAPESTERPLVAELTSRLVARLGRPEVSGSTEQSPTEIEAFNDYLQALSWIDIGECSREAIALLEGAESALLTETGDGRLADGAPPVDYKPFLTKARAFWNCRDRAGVEASLARARDLGDGSVSEVEALSERLRQTPMGVYGESHALVAVSHDYHHDDESGWEDLPGARDDIEAVRHALATQGFSVEVLENPTSEKLLTRFRKFVTRYGRNPANRLVLYYAGHGWTEEAVGIKRGYIVPVDSPHPDHTDESFEFLLSMGVFELHSAPMLARHALFVFDTCFGGLVFGPTREDLAPSRDGEGTVADAAALLEKPVRMFLSAGNENQTVPDFSVFRRILIRGLDGEADRDGDELVLGRELGEFVREVVSETSYTTPQWGVLTGGELGLGDIAFQGTGAADETAARRLRTELDYWATVWGSPEARRYEDYLELYPGGAFAALADWRLRQLAATAASAGH